MSRDQTQNPLNLLVCNSNIVGFPFQDFENVHIYFIRKQERKCTCNNNIEVHSRKHCCHGKKKSITYSGFVSIALVTQHTKCMPHII